MRCRFGRALHPQRLARPRLTCQCSRHSGPTRPRPPAPRSLSFRAAATTCSAPHEGTAYARWLNDLGITAFVLKYRLVKDGYHLPEILGDAALAVRLVRANATDWQLDPRRIGIIGSSAGGHLSATLMTQCDAGRPDAEDQVERVSSRPDLVILCYAFILFDRNDKPDRQTRFLGPNPSQEQIQRFSPALNVTKDCPPCFIWQTIEDTSVVPENAMVIADSLRKAGVPFDLHLYQKGRHGIGLGAKEYDPAKGASVDQGLRVLVERAGLLESQLRARTRRGGGSR